MVYLWEGAKPHPSLVTKNKNLAFSLEPEVKEDELKDPEVLTTDLLEFLIHRSNILGRIEHCLVNEFSTLNDNGVRGILMLLVRIARHSPNALVDRKPLLRALIDKYASAHWLASGKR
jgi:hypothetical protein